jgi:cytochrome b
MDAHSPQETANRRRPRRAPAYAGHPFVPVWDVPVRVVHWTIVASLAALVTTGLVGGDWLAWHMRIGRLLLGLVLFRVLWGFVGSRNARFYVFVQGPRSVVRYARSLRRGHEAHATHNPLGAWMVMLLIAALLVQAGTGLFTNDDVLWDGPLVKWVTKETSDAISSIHRKFWWLLAAFAALHVTAAVSYLVVFRDNLIGAMFTGKKRLPPGVADPRDAEASNVKAFVLAGLCGLVVGYVLYRL